MKNDRLSGFQTKALGWIREDAVRSVILVLFFADALLGLFAFVNSGPYGRLYPNPPPDLELFNDYPTARDTYERSWGVNSGPLFRSSGANDRADELLEYSFSFETDDPPSEVAAYYGSVAANSGWQLVTVRQRDDSRNPERHHYHFGDFRRSLHNYYLDIFAVAVDASYGTHLATYARIRIERTLPIYPQATNITANKACGIDDCDWTVEFSSKDPPHEILAFYKEILPTSTLTNRVWSTNSTWSNATQLYWNIGKTSNAEVSTSQESGLTRVKVNVYHGCCGGMLREHSLHGPRPLGSY
jgi:hypothetical protein